MSGVGSPGSDSTAWPALESAAFQPAELLAAKAADGVAPQRLRVDGGMARNDWYLQFLADVLGVEVVRPMNTETTAFGAAILAAVGAGEFGSLQEAAGLWKLDRKFEPAISAADRADRLAGWKLAVGLVLTH